MGGTLQKAHCLEALGHIDEAEQAYLATLIEQRQLWKQQSATHSGFRYHADAGLWRNLDPLIHDRVIRLANMPPTSGGVAPS